MSRRAALEGDTEALHRTHSFVALWPHCVNIFNKPAIRLDYVLHIFRESDTEKPAFIYAANHVLDMPFTRIFIFFIATTAKTNTT